MKIYRLDKVVLAFRNNPVQFLKGISSNTIDQPKNAFLDMHGRIVATFDQLKVNDDVVLVVIEKKFYEPLLQHLDRYIRISKAEVTREDYRVYYDFGETVPIENGDFVISQRSGQLLITPKELPNSVSEEEFTLFRVQNNIPLQGVDYHDEMLLNVDEAEMVSFTKGCFLGQELIAKVHNRSHPPRKLVVKFEDECDDTQKTAMTSKVKVPQTGRMLGFVFVNNRP